MLDRIEYQFYVLVMNIFSSLYLFTFYWGTLLSFLSGLFLPVVYFDKPERDDLDTWFRRLIIAAGVLLFIFGTISNFSIPALINWAKALHGAPLVDLHYSLSEWLLIPIFCAGIFTHWWGRRHLSGKINQLKIKHTKRTEVARDERTDVRHVRDYLPETVDYDPEDHINLKMGVFVGLDVNRQPQYIPLADIQKQHMDILGTTGAGKGVASGLILYQLIQAGEGVFVLDPKNDEWAPHLLKAACEKAGKPFHLIDLNQATPQLNLLANTTPEQIEELLVAGFSFAEKGDIADFYRIDDRKAARQSPQLATEDERKTFKGLLQSDHVKGLKDDVKAFYGKMEELSEVQSVNAPEGLNMQSVFDDGGCCYIIGSLRNAKIIMTQKMILIRLFQLAEMRDRVNSTPKPIAIFLDELKYHISKAAMEGLGAARDKGIHMLLAHQSVADLRDCPADLNSDAVVGAVVENTKIKLVYKLQDPETAEWVAKMSGTILVDDESRTVELNAALTETVEGRRNIRLAERYFVDTNMLLNLPPFVSYIFTATEVPKPSLISPIKVSKSTLENFEEIRQKKLEKSKPSPKKEPIKHDHIEEIRQKIRSTQEDNPNMLETQADSSNMADNENRASEEAHNNSGLVPRRTEESNTQPYPSSIPENEAPASDENYNDGVLTPQHKDVTDIDNVTVDAPKNQDEDQDTFDQPRKDAASETERRAGLNEMQNSRKGNEHASTSI
ncbi:type IV secretory system conjugative DNA transfer family protein [Vibrio splendidus]|uniref:type IV secretory system conjugative DNA transfer family protein n=1 Tax=Vibrio splendidus TaxID=29497 RepID=UPI000C86817A|nr:type IV secretion system DNA-binding domain-containing protein [Vibrio splendidus]PMO24160.1 molybdopterin-guanine dinucleotide biosynthesis protein MobB [Vibrio splendidus]